MLEPVSDARTDTPTAAFFQTTAPDSEDPAPALRRGIAAARATIPPWYLYDVIGSRLFDVITVLPDYYPTRTEAAILTRYATEMAKAVPVTGGPLIDLGAGSCEKAPRLFGAVQPSQYVPVDISVDYLRDVVSKLQHEHPEIEMIGVGTDFSKQLVLPDEVRRSRRVFFYPGSSIGNFDPAAATTFLRGVRGQMDADAALWIGVDLKKDVATLERAYDDEMGVTAAFNRNVLRNVNELAGTDFRPRQWQHRARFDEDLSRIEMLLEAREDLVVTWPGGERRFAAGENIHTESSYKYTPDRFRELLHSAGLDPVGMWTDELQRFAFFVASPAS
ncbi:MAG: L-histidine N(alpha)-methyltransferase [Planctomycetes bacterium]|nr:L-histidine N(alpha)-methyltransferase [Planctomycetota bacterium]